MNTPIKGFLILFLVIIILLFFTSKYWSYTPIDKTISKSFHTKGNNVYSYPNGNILATEPVKIKEADKNTFEVLSEALAKDKNKVYFYEEILELDVNTLEMLNQYYFKDETNTYFSNFKIDVDTKTFEVIKGNYVKDKNNVYFTHKIIKGANSSSFEVLNEEYSKDNLNLYWQHYRVSNFGPELPKNYEQLTGKKINEDEVELIVNPYAPKKD
jgi:hypothetical protein